MTMIGVAQEAPQNATERAEFKGFLKNPSVWTL
jgi:hypothetical protein